MLFALLGVLTERWLSSRTKMGVDALAGGCYRPNIGEVEREERRKRRRQRKRGREREGGKKRRITSGRRQFFHLNASISCASDSGGGCLGLYSPLCFICTLRLIQLISSLKVLLVVTEKWFVSSNSHVNGSISNLFGFVLGSSIIKGAISFLPYSPPQASLCYCNSRWSPLLLPSPPALEFLRSFCMHTQLGTPTLLLFASSLVLLPCICGFLLVTTVSHPKL